MPCLYKGEVLRTNSKHTQAHEGALRILREEMGESDESNSEILQDFKATQSNVKGAKSKDTKTQACVPWLCH